MKKPGVLITVFLLLLLAVGAVSVYAFYDTQTVSESENRTLNKRPVLSEETWFSGAFASGMEEFLTDHIFQRTEIINAANRLEAALERKTEVKLVSHNAAEIVAGGANADATDAPAAASEDAVVVDTVAAQETQQDRLVLEDRILSVYQDAPDNLAYYARVANSFFAMFPDYINKYCLLAPSRIAFETPDIAQYSDDQRAAIAYTYERMDPLVTTIDAYSALEAYDGPLNDLYFRTDHHWTHLGAYRAAEAMFQAIDKEYFPLDDYERKEGNTFLGYYYAQDRNPALESHEDSLVYYVPKTHDVPHSTLYIPQEGGMYSEEKALTVNPMRGGYYTFAGSAFAYIVMDGARMDAGCILLVADSYGNAFGTWLAENYSRVIQIDPRDYTAGREGVLALAKEYGVTDVMLCDYLGAVDSAYFPSQIAHLTE